MKAIIGGTGVYGIGKGHQETVNTPYGEVQVDIISAPGKGEIAFLSRHGKDGKGHSVPPHLINYRANMAALKAVGAKEVFATCAVGSMKREFGVGEVVVLKDFIDFTKNRISTFFDGGGNSKDGVSGDIHDGRVRHVDMSEPYCPSLRERFYEAARSNGVSVKGEAVYVCTEGPRFETASEIRMYAAMGGDVVGMTNVPEVVLAKELGICYAAVGLVSNMCTGIGNQIELHDIASALEQNKRKVTDTFVHALFSGSEKKQCNCNHSVIIL